MDIKQDIGVKKVLEGEKLSKIEGIIPALEPAHAIGWLFKNKKSFSTNDLIILNLCGRGDKDIYTVAKALNIEI